MKRLLLLSVLLLVGLSIVAAQPQWTEFKKVGDDSIQYLQLRGLQYLPSGVVWVTGGDYPYTGFNFALRSTDHGQTWTKNAIYTNATLGSIGTCGIAAKDANNACVATTTGEILRTTNGGTQWDTVFSYADPSVAFCDGIAYIGTDSLLAFGDADALGMFVATSYDGGATWTRNMSLPDSAMLPTYYASYVTFGKAMDVYGKHIWITMYYGSSIPPAMLYSSDAGATWAYWKIALPTGLPNNYYLRSISMKDENVGYGVSRRIGTSTAGDNYLVKTTDGGRTWSDTICVDPTVAHTEAKPAGIAAIRGTNTVVVVGYTSTGSRAWVSTDNAATWNTLNNPGGYALSDLKHIEAISATQFFAVGYKNISKYASLTGVEEAPVALPTGFALTQNYPNPFNPTTTIQYSIAKTGMVELRVYDMLGRMVSTLVQGEQTAGAHSVVFHASHLTSGVYFYTLKSGGMATTRSLVLLK